MRSPSSFLPHSGPARYATYRRPRKSQWSAAPQSYTDTPNHSHIVDNSRVNTQPIWWQVRPVLVMHQEDWPAADGSSGITSATAMDAAENAGRAVEVGSNFFLFFDSKLSAHDMHH